MVSIGSLRGLVRRRREQALAFAAVRTAGALGVSGEGAHPLVGPGANAQRVKAVQRMVNQATSSKVLVDGIYGDKTIAAVAFLQRRVALPPDGIADPITLVLGQARIEQQHRTAALPRQFILQLPSDENSLLHLLIRADQKLYVPRVLERKGLAGYEPETLAVWLAALQLAGEGAALDIGANMGLFSLLAAARTSRKIIAFEPTPVLAETVRSIGEDNHLHIDIEQLALGRQRGLAELHLSSASDASNSLASGFRKAQGSLTVRVETLDGYCARAATTPAVLKIDTETTEADVLCGGLEVIKKARPWIICELLPGHREGEIPEVLKDTGYRYIHITHELSGREHPAPFGHADARNWLFAPSDPPAEFWTTARSWYDRLLLCRPESVADPL